MQEMKDMVFCQSCGMPMEGQAYGTEADGKDSADYCSYCYEKGAFTSDTTMEEMAKLCAPEVAKSCGISDAEAHSNMLQFFPTLKRWQA